MRTAGRTNQMILASVLFYDAVISQMFSPNSPFGRLNEDTIVHCTLYIAWLNLLPSWAYKRGKIVQSKITFS